MEPEADLTESWYDATRRAFSAAWGDTTALKIAKKLAFDEHKR